MKYQDKDFVKIISLSTIFTMLTMFTQLAIGISSQINLAIQGYDTVAYFTNAKAVKGNKSFSYQWHGMTWIFLNKKHRNMFASNPKKFAPQYDGYCAWAMTEKRLANTNPNVWRIVQGKLYLNCSRAAYAKWIKDIPGNIKKADANWSKLSR